MSNISVILEQTWENTFNLEEDIEETLSCCCFSPHNSVMKGEKKERKVEKDSTSLCRF